MATLQELEKRQGQLKAQIQKRKNLVRAKERKQDVRRKILIGAWLLSIKDPEWIKEKMNSYLERDTDRKLFSLESKSNFN